MFRDAEAVLAFVKSTVTTRRKVPRGDIAVTCIIFVDNHEIW